VHIADLSHLPCAPRRVAIIGCCGAGKSTLAAQLAPALGLPLIHLDREYWQPGWVQTPREHWIPRHEQLIAEPTWLIDGNYGNTMARRLERADLVVLLIVPARVSLWRVMRRTWRDRGRTRPDMAPGCAEAPWRRSTFAFWGYVAWFNRRHLPTIRARIAEHAAGRAVVVHSAADARNLVARIRELR